MRDAHVVETIAGQLQKYKTVLVVYGVHHFHAQKPIFDTLLSPGKENVFVPAHPCAKGGPTPWDLVSNRNVLHPAYKLCIIQNAL